MNTDRPLDGVASIKVKLGLLVGASVVVAVIVAGVGEVAEVPWWMSVPVTVAAALAVTQWLARGMTSPLREMTDAARGMAGGDYAQRVTASSSDEVGTLARAFNAMAADLASADQQRRQLVATVSHELRTPLTAQRALLENLVDGVVRPDDDALRAALTQSERLSALVGDLLDLSRIDAGAAPLRLTEVQVGDLLRDGVAEALVGGRPVARGPRDAPGRPHRGRRPGAARASSSPTSSTTRCGTARPGERCGSSPAASGRTPGGSRSATTVPASRPTAWSGSSTGSAPAATTPAAPGSAWPSRAGSASCTAASSRRCRPPPEAPVRTCAPSCRGAPAPAGPPTCVRRAP